MLQPVIIIANAANIAMNKMLFLNVVFDMTLQRWTFGYYYVRKNEKFLTVFLYDIVIPNPVRDDKSHFFLR